MSSDILAYWHRGGPLMVVLAVLSYGIWYYFLKLRGPLLGVVRAPDTFEHELLNRLSSEPPDQTRAHYARGADPLSRMVTQVLGASREPGPAFDLVREEQLERVRRDLLVLAALTVAAPLVGLLGTVIGMIETFRAVAGEFGQTSARVSAGIRQALVTTQFGLVVAIPGLFGAERIRRLMDQAAVRMGTCRVHLVFGLANPAGKGTTP